MNVDLETQVRPRASQGQEQIRLAWWNVGLSPRRKKKNRPSGTNFETVIEILRGLLSSEEVDLVALGEVSPKDAEDLYRRLDMPLRTFIDQESGTGIAALFKSSSLQLVEHRVLTEAYVDKELKRGCRLYIETADCTLSFYLFLCHWPSRMVGEQSAREREELATGLTRHLRDLRGASRDPVIIMGDFNDEPFDRSLSDRLLGSRDRSLVKKRSALLYNPFWRLLGERQDIRNESNRRLAAGTYYYSSHQLTRWFTFDQALVSGSLLGGKTWTLNESGVGALQTPVLLREGARMRSGFDHLPIAITLVKDHDQWQASKMLSNKA